MTCPRCQGESPPGSNFCTVCGARLATACGTCGNDVPAGARFCNQCGTAVSAEAAAPRFSAPDVYTPRHLAERILTSKSALEGERKHITVLFADLKSSMQLIANVDPEEARTLLDPVIQLMMEAVHRYEGTVNQVMGDGIMALFGAPLAHEDHAVRACYAALTIQETAGRWAAAAGRGQGLDLQIRIGINSGEVLVRSIRNDLRMDYTAIGQTTFLAARMEQMARPASVLLTGNTARLIEGRMEVMPQGRLSVKGVSEPIAAYELVGATRARSRLEIAASRGLTPFIGREAETAVILEAAGHAARGRGHVVAIVGDPGVGKSRLIWELTRSGLLQHWVVLEGHAMPYDKESPYRPILELLGAAFGLQPDDGADTIRQRVMTGLGREALAHFLAPIVALMGLPADDPQWVRLDAEQQRRRTVEALKYVLVGRARERPTAIVVEDLHWADSETLAVLDALVDGAAAAHVLVIVSYRPEHRHEWGGKSYYRQIALDALAPRDTEILLDQLLGPAASPAAVKRMLAERTGGNPFFLEESVRNLAESGALAGERGAYRLVHVPSTTEVPETVFAVLAARIDRLAAADKRVLQTASAIGKDVPRALLAAIADVPSEELPESLARLRSSEFLYEAHLFPELEYTFRHALTHEVAYASLPRGRRMALDARIVTALEARRQSETDWRQVDRLAHHATRGELWDKTIVYSRQAGQQALSRHAHRAAAAYFEQAIAALAHAAPDPGSVGLAIDLRLELRYALGPLGRYRRVSELLTEARELAEAAGERARLGLISCLLSNRATLRFEFDTALAHGAQAIEIATALRDGALAAATNGILSLAHFATGDFLRAVEAGRQAERPESDVWRERFGLVIPPPVYGASVGSWALAELGEFAEAHRMAARGLAAAEKLDHPQSIAFACLAVGIIHLRQGTPAVDVLERATRLCEQADLPAVFLEVAGSLASAYVAAGRAADAIALLERAVAQALALRHRLGHVLRTSSMAEALLAADRAEEAEPLAELYVQLARSVNSRGQIAWALRLFAEAAGRKEPADASAAEAALEECVTLAGALGMRPLHARALFTRGRLLQRLGRSDEARATLAEAAERFRALSMTSWAEACGAAGRGRS